MIRVPMVIISMFVFSNLAYAEECGGTFLKSMGAYPKGFQQEVQDYHYENGEKVYGVFRAGNFKAKFIRLDKTNACKNLKHDREYEKIFEKIR